MKPAILQDWPIPILTERLVLRPISPGDGLAFFEAVDESRVELDPWLPWPHTLKTIDDAEAAVRKFYAQFIQRDLMYMFMFQGTRLIGGCGLKFDFEIPSAAIGYWCRTSALGQGYVREAIRALTQYAFEQLKMRRVTILCDAKNVRSSRVAEALGFSLESKALGLVPDFQNTSPDAPLRLCHTYVRFNSVGL